VKAVVAPEPGVRGRLLDCEWDHPRSKRRTREVWRAGREVVAKLGLPRPFDPPEWTALRAIASSSDAPQPGAGHDAALDRLVAGILAGTSVVAPAGSAAPFVRVPS
jgi:hypothetical protein